MLSQAHITEWGAGAPWPDPVQVEQDLILSRMLVQAAEDELLRETLAFRGGTCLQKLHLPSPLRYSEDLDYVRTDMDPRLGEIFDRFRAIADDIGLIEHRRKFPGPHSDMGTIWFTATPTEGQGAIRIKLECNVAETEPFLPLIASEYEVRSRWWSGKASIPTFQLDDLLGTKLRALFQRRKGRDLFDLWTALTQLEVKDAKVVAALTHYMKDRTFSYPELRMNLREKIADPGFNGDIGSLVVEMPADYDNDTAAHLVLDRLGRCLRNSPPEGEAVSLA